MDSVSGVAMQLTLQINGQPVVVEVLERKGQALRIALGGVEYHFIGKRDAQGLMTLDQEIAPGVWRRVRGAAWHNKGVNQLQLGGYDFAVADGSGAVAHKAAEAPLAPRAPMPGLVRQVLVKKGQLVTLGQDLVVMEAMKLQLSLAAGGNALVAEVLVSAGDMVAEGAELVRLVTR